MDIKKVFGFEGKTVVVTGAFSGMGQAAAELLCELGADVYAVCRRNGRHTESSLAFKEVLYADFENKQDIKELAAALPSRIDAIFLCHGIACKNDGSNALQVQKVNFLGHKYFLEQVIDKVTDAGSVTIISSTGGYGWQDDLETIMPVVQAETYEDALAWYDAHPDEILSGYVFSKKCLNAYTEYMCHNEMFIDRKIRLNTICPGNTITGLTDEFARETVADGDKDAGMDIIESIFLSSWDGYWASKEQMGYPMVAIGSDIFSYMSGQVIYFDYGVSSEWDMGDYL